MSSSLAINIFPTSFLLFLLPTTKTRIEHSTPFDSIVAVLFCCCFCFASSLSLVLSVFFSFSFCLLLSRRHVLLEGCEGPESERWMVDGNSTMRWGWIDAARAPSLSVDDVVVESCRCWPTRGREGRPLRF
ncbi:hypothetical protein R3P38DRAFT_3116894 [Favolaschia claudopus]|uniref:Transmembrane protein n=1 Tax=Favolaschia claudopus TaxID=2862362 RepID=A0AAV9ZG03_9AGAR